MYFTHDKPILPAVPFKDGDKLIICAPEVRNGEDSLADLSVTEVDGGHIVATTVSLIADPASEMIVLGYLTEAGLAQVREHVPTSRHARFELVAPGLQASSYWDEP